MKAPIRKNRARSAAADYCRAKDPAILGAQSFTLIVIRIVNVSLPLATLTEPACSVVAVAMHNRFTIHSRTAMRSVLLILVETRLGGRLQDFNFSLVHALERRRIIFVRAFPINER